MRHLAPPLIALSFFGTAAWLYRSWKIGRQRQRMRLGYPHDGSRPNAYTYDARYSAGVAMTDNQ